MWALAGRADVVTPDLAVQCALHHDTVEDTAVSVEELDHNFGFEVADGVAALTKDKTLPEAERMSDSLRRIREQPREIWMVKLADRIVNLRPPPAHWNDDKIDRYRAEAKEIHAQLHEACPRLSARLLDKIASYGRSLAGPGPEQQTR